MTNVKPIFIFSLPRSGSTLLQRMLGNHHLIHTVSEPWILLPLFDLINYHGTFSEYSRHNTSLALKDFYHHLPGAEEHIYKEIRSFCLSLYSTICFKEKKTAKYFLDKTPRYHLVIDKICHAFPDAKFIFLFRNPLSVVSSMLLTEPKNVWSLYFFNIDLYKGLENLICFQTKYSASSIKVNYEDLVENPTHELRQIYEYLEINDADYAINLHANQFLAGRMGDQIIPYKENQFNLNSINKWETVINNPVRRSWCRHYLKWIGKERLNAMGYNMESLEIKLDELDVSVDRQSFNDIYRILFGIFYSTFEFTIVKQNLKNFSHYSKIGAKT